MFDCDLLTETCNLILSPYSEVDSILSHEVKYISTNFKICYHQKLYPNLCIFFYLHCVEEKPVAVSLNPHRIQLQLQKKIDFK